MFTGIVECTGIIKSIVSSGSNKSFLISSPVSSSLKVDQSVSHNGICLTVESTDGSTHTVTAIAETLSKTNMHDWQDGDVINMERCMQINGRIDGHIVQGHVDATARCMSVDEANGSWQYSFEFDEIHAPLIIEKGSVCVNGISLTAFNVGRNTFSVAIIPYTYHHTNIQHIQKGMRVNIEFDIIGKYLLRFREVTGEVRR